MPKKSIILDEKQVHNKIRRIAFEIYEHNFSEKEIFLAGIYDRGYTFSQHVKKALESISPLKVNIIKVELNKISPLQTEVTLDCDKEILKGKSIIIVDDVLNTGRTLVYSFKAFLNVEIKKMEVAVLIKRSHKLFPVSANYIGYELSTTFNEHVEVNLNKPMSVCLY